MDIVCPEKRKIMMSGIKSKNTIPELLIRGALFSKGFRYRINDSKLPGKPDIVLKKYNSVIFIHGCFWHQHSCPKNKIPEINHEFWKKKLMDNIKRDKKVINDLLNENWRVCIIWECKIIKIQKIEDSGMNEILNRIIDFLESNMTLVEI